jgi:hypothetical protein
MVWMKNEINLNLRVLLLRNVVMKNGRFSAHKVIYWTDEANIQLKDWR